MKRAASLLFIAALLFAPHLSQAATKKLSVTLTSPSSDTRFAAGQDTVISYRLKNVDRDMVAWTSIHMVAPVVGDTSSGYESDTTYEFTVHKGDTSGSFTHTWEHPIPGRYAITTELRECNPAGCDQAPAGKALSKRSDPVEVLVGVTPQSLGLTLVGSSSPFVTPKGVPIAQPPSDWYYQVVADNQSGNGKSGYTQVNFYDPDKLSDAFMVVVISDKSLQFPLTPSGQDVKLKTLSRSSAPFKGFPAYQIVQEGVKDGYPFKMRILGVETSSKLYFIGAITEKKYWKQYAPEFDSIIRSLQVR